MGFTYAPKRGSYVSMKLATYMADNGITARQMADLIGRVSESGVRKWMYDERVPRPEILARIHAATGGAVTANDFMPQLTAARFDAMCKAQGIRVTRSTSPNPEEAA